MERRVLDQPLRDIAKAWTLKHLAEDRPKNIGSPRNLLEVWRRLEVGLLDRGLTSSPEFITPDVLDEVNLAIRMADRTNDSRKYELCLLLNRLVDGLQESGLVRTRFNWKGMTVKPESNFNRVGDEFDLKRNKMLLTDHEMASVGYGFSQAELPQHRYPMAIAAILAGQPSRIGELLDLPVDCAFDDEKGGEKLFVMRWRPEKGGKPMQKEFVYATNPWIPNFKKAIAWLTEISEPARKMAKWYEDNPGKIHLPERLEYLRTKEWLELKEVADILQVNPPKFVSRFEHKYLFSRKMPLYGEKGGMRKVRFEDLERSVLADLPPGFPVMNRASGLKYSEALCLLRVQEFKGTRRFDTSPSNVMIQAPSYQRFKRALDQAFDDLGRTNMDGGLLRISTHKFRHRWCTAAEEAGIWRWFNNAMSGRLKISQADAYDHMTADHVHKVRAELLPEGGRLFGEILAFTPKEPLYAHEVERQIEELGMLKAIVLTPFGICINDFVQSPCEYHNDCLNCGNHDCVKGLPARTENIRKRLELQEKALAGARIALENGDYGVEDHIRQTLEPNVQRLRAIVQVLDDPRFPLGTQILLAHGPDGHPITKATQFRIETRKAQGLNTAMEESMLASRAQALEFDLGSPVDL
ncbi:DNA-binding protein [Mesoterricola silvestris]|uniref:DNA-binding protein n=2 Tax=Mesoterricola silvestris TaxID=2927979 RepID=A0AA48K6I7_9BACT|nr:DNA-binding protein [Mesoterricola silvestris]